VHATLQLSIVDQASSEAGNDIDPEGGAADKDLLVVSVVLRFPQNESN
jgi:hypothetical protein